MSDNISHSSQNQQLPENNLIQKDCDEVQVHTLYAYLNPCIPLVVGGERCRSRDSSFLILSTLYQMQKKVRDKVWTQIFCCEETIAKSSGVCRKTVQRFINSSQFQNFCDIDNRIGETHIYTLKNWVIRIFRFFEMQGLLKNITKNFKEWKRKFITRMKKFFLPQLLQGKTLDQLFVNNLRTKQSFKCPGSPPLKCPPIQSSCDSSKIDNDTGDVSSFAKEAETIEKAMNTKLNIPKADTYKFMRNYSLSENKRALQLASSYFLSPIVCSPVRLYQSCLNKVLRGKNNVF